MALVFVFALVVSCNIVILTAAILIMITLTSALVIIYRNGLLISSDTSLFMSVNIRASVLTCVLVSIVNTTIHI